MAMMLWRLHIWLPAVALAGYVFAQWCRGRAVGETVSPAFVDEPAATRRAVTLYPYYELHLPLAVLASASLVHAGDVLVALAHAAAFDAGRLRLALTQEGVRLIRAISPAFRMVARLVGRIRRFSVRNGIAA